MAFDTGYWRKRFNRLDDVQLDTLAMDEFRPVYDQFSRGLQHLEKINLLLDHCYRCCPSESQVQELEHRLRRFFNELFPEEAAGDGASRRPGFELIELCHLDFTEQVNELAMLPIENDLIVGLGVPCKTLIPVWMENFCRRLSYILECSDMDSDWYIPLDPLRGDVPEAIQYMKEIYMPRGRRKGGVFWAPRVANHILLDFWQALIVELHAAPQHKRLVAVLPFDPDDGTPLPEAIHRLPPPRLVYKDVEDWLSCLKEKDGLSEALIRSWMDYIKRRFLRPPGQPLSSETTFLSLLSHIKHMIDFVESERPTEAAFLEEMEEYGNWR